MMEFYALSIPDLFSRLETSSQGLSSEEVEKRKKIYGKNLLQETKTSLWKIFFRQFNNILIYILMVASFVTVYLGAMADFFMILAIILLNGFLGFWQEIKAESSIAALKKMTESKSQVVRQGKTLLIASSELVPGDFLILHEGEVVTADVRLVDSKGLMVDESSMTGESMPVLKDHTQILPKEALPYEMSNMLLTGTVVVRGACQGVVVKTGAQTYLASIAEKVKEPAPVTPLVKALKFFSRQYAIALMIIFSFLGFAGVIQGREIFDLGYILLAGLVSAVPEGLLIVVTLVMVFGALALSRKQALIRYLPSVETLGSVTVIASDKTGTITEGKLQVKEVFTQQEDLLKKIGALCNDAEGGLGDPLDVALAKWVGKGYASIRKENIRDWTHSFDTRAMFMATVHSDSLYIKGAYEALKEKGAENREMEAKFHEFLDKGLRVIAFGKGKWDGNQNPQSWKIELVGLIGFLDPAKEGVYDSVIAAQEAKVRVIMITGDHPMTAKAVASEVGIWKAGDEILVGKHIEILTDEQLIDALSTTTVLARILPEHKYRVVKTLQQTGQIVAVTGDGVNDVPALKAADIGIAMGSGTEAAKAVSKMILADNRLSVIVDAIRNARTIADNIRKVIYYLISTSMQEVSFIAYAIFADLPLPLLAIQILWVNLVTGGAMDKTFCFIKEEPNVMKRGPRAPEKQFFDWLQIFRIVFYGVFAGLFCLFLYLHLLDTYVQKEVSTIIFTSVVVIQWANGIQSQKESEPFFKNIKRSLSINPTMFIGLGIALFLQLFAVYLAPEPFHSTPLHFGEWRYPLYAFLAGFFLVEIRKWGELAFKRVSKNISR